MPNDRTRVMFFVGSMGGGGAERQIVEQLKRIDRNRFLPHLYLHHRRGALLNEVPKDVVVHSFWDQFSGTLQSKWHHLWGTTDQARIGHLARAIRTHHIDVLINQTHLATLDAAAACDSMGNVGRISVCVADPLEEIRLYSTPETFAATRKQSAAAYDSADAVLAVSDGVRQRLIQDLSLDPQRINVFLNRVDIQSAQRLATNALPSPADQQFADRETIHLLSMARLSHEKGLDVMMDAMQRLVHGDPPHSNHPDSGQPDSKAQPALHWHILGEGPLREQLIAQRDANGLSDHVTFHGFHQNPYPFYAAADLLVAPSRHEAFGCVLIESLACATPVLATDCPSGPAEVLQQGELGRLVPPDDSQSLRIAINDFLRDRSVWQTQCDAAIESIRQRFAWEPAVRWLEDLIKRVASGRDEVRSPAIGRTES